LSQAQADRAFGRQALASVQRPKNQNKMKTLLTVILLMTFVSIGFSQDSTQVADIAQKPKAEYKVGSAIVTVWVNKKSDGTTWKNYQVKKIYKNGNATDSW
jgi:hypothetical protein